MRQGRWSAIECLMKSERSLERGFGAEHPQPVPGPDVLKDYVGRERLESALDAHEIELVADARRQIGQPDDAYEHAVGTVGQLVRVFCVCAHT